MSSLANKPMILKRITEKVENKEEKRTENGNLMGVADSCFFLVKSKMLTPEN